MKEISAIDNNLSSLVSTIQEATIQIEETTHDLRSYKENIDFNPARLDQLESRLDQIKGLKRKYGDSIEEILQFRDRIAAELDIINSGDEKVAHLEANITRLRQEYDTKALELTKKRKQLAGILEKEIARELQELMMPQVKFKVDFTENTEPTPFGLDQIQFLISPNPGEPLKPLSKIASGGELSRIMLALKAILARLDEIPTLIFDEIDAGLGGRAAHAVAEKLAKLGENRQVICVTHSPQVASFGNNHLYINKEIKGQRTLTKVKTLDKKERINELARMLGGREVTELTVKHAAELLAQAVEANNSYVD